VTVLTDSSSLQGYRWHVGRTENFFIGNKFFGAFTALGGEKKFERFFSGNIYSTGLQLVTHGIGRNLFTSSASVTRG
jgi:hypothetical protein